MAINDQHIPETLSGQGETNASGILDIVFTTPFPDKLYSITITPLQNCRVRWRNKDQFGFRIKTEDEFGANVPNVNVGWQVVRFSNE